MLCRSKSHMLNLRNDKHHSWVILNAFKASNYEPLQLAPPESIQAMKEIKNLLSEDDLESEFKS